MNQKLLTLSALAVALSATLVQSCTTDDHALKETFLDLPQTLESYNVGPDDNIPTLGRVLFYDANLSINNTVSCSSCHKQNLAFTDNARFSVGFGNKLTPRNSMPIQNLGGSGFGFEDGGFVDPGFGLPASLFWDGREHDLGTMVLQPIVNHVEMGVTDFNQLSKKLGAIPYYRELFLKAFGSEEVTEQKISIGLRSFVASIRSQNTFLDKSFRGEYQMSALEQRGQQLFIEVYDCNQCHQVMTPNGYASLGGGFANVGLDQEYTDGGLEDFTKLQADNGKFKIPSLRNVMFTAPYMHDGRFETLEEVIEHYSSGIEDNDNLDLRLRDVSGAPMRLNIPAEDAKAIIAFMGTLTDSDMLSAKRFSNPFKTK